MATSRRRPRGACDGCTVHECRACGVKKDAKEFYARRRPDGTRFHRRDCIPCVRAAQQDARRADPEKYREYTRTYYENNSWRARDSVLRRKYGIAYEEFLAMHGAQGGLCALCSTGISVEGEAHVDHDHATGRVRSLLCRHCNTGLGNFRDDSDLIMRAALYVLQHREEPVNAFTA